MSNATLPPVEATTVREFARRYSLCRASVYVEIQEGRLTARKIGGKTVILRQDAERWVESLPCIKPRKSGRGRPPKYPMADDRGAPLLAA